MNTKRVVGTHLIVGIVLGTILGVSAWISETDGPANMFLAVPAGIAVLFIGYSGPVVAGVLVLALLRRAYPEVSLGVYLVAYYALLVYLFVLVFSRRDEADSGFALLFVPSLPVFAFGATLAIALARGLFRKLRY